MIMFEGADNLHVKYVKWRRLWYFRGVTESPEGYRLVKRYTHVTEAIYPTNFAICSNLTISCSDDTNRDFYYNKRLNKAVSVIEFRATIVHLNVFL